MLVALLIAIAPIPMPIPLGLHLEHRRVAEHPEGDDVAKTGRCTIRITGFMVARG